MFKKVEQKRWLLRSEEILLKAFRQTVMSYLGVCSHANTESVKVKLKEIYRGEYTAKAKERLLKRANK